MSCANSQKVFMHLTVSSSPPLAFLIATFNSFLDLTAPWTLCGFAALELRLKARALHRDQQLQQPVAVVDQRLHALGIGEVIAAIAGLESAVVADHLTSLAYQGVTGTVTSEQQ
jgi:hypothetical protein